MSRKMKPPTIVQDGEGQWSDDDFNLDSFGVETPLKERVASLAESGLRSEEVSEDTREKYARYVERVRLKREKAEQKVKKAKT